jgi:pentapeptide MXKDX repeat protein
MSVDEMPVDEMSVDKMSVDEMPVDEMSVDEMPVDEMSVDEMSVDEMSVDEMSVDELTCAPPSHPRSLFFSTFRSFHFTSHFTNLGLVSHLTLAATFRTYLTPSPP